MQTLKIKPSVLCAVALSFQLAAAAAENRPGAATKLKPYPLATCVVSDEKLDSMGEPFVFAFKDREIKTCCQDCRKEFDKEPEKFIQKLVAAEKRAAPASVKNIGPAEFEKLRRDKENVVLDVRTPKEFAAGHMPGAILIDFNSPDFEKKVAQLDKSKTYLVHCAGGVRSAKACGKLSQLNFQSLYNLEGGMRAWEKAGNKPER